MEYDSEVRKATAEVLTMAGEACLKCPEPDGGLCPECIADAEEFARVYAEFLGEPAGEGH